MNAEFTLKLNTKHSQLNTRQSQLNTNNYLFDISRQCPLQRLLGATITVYNAYLGR